MLYTIYKITNNLNGKIYIGKHQTLDANDSYYGSGKAIVNAIKKHGKENFTKEILFIFQTEEEMNNKEKELITEEFVLREDTYNLGVGGEGGAHFKGMKHSEETRERIKELWEKEDYRTKVIAGSSKAGSMSKGRKLSGTAKENIRRGAIARSLNNPHSDETKKKISESLKNHYNDNLNPNRKSKRKSKRKPETKKRQRQPLSEETKEKLRLRSLERWEKQRQNNLTQI